MPESCFKLMQISEDGSDIKLLYMQNKMPDISLEEGSYAGFTEFTFNEFCKFRCTDYKYESYRILDETRFVGFYYDSYKYSQVVSLFTKRNPVDIKDKTVLVLAGYYIPHEVKNRVVQFNKANPEYRIVMKEYHTYDTMEDGMAGYNRLNMDILGRGLPDILIAYSYFPVSSYISKGLVADIDTLIRADEELSQTEFLENVFDAYRIEGKLYYVTPSFSVNTLIGKESLVGNRTSWTMKEMQELLASMPEGTQSIGELTRSDFVQMMIQYCGNDFIDAKDGKCDVSDTRYVNDYINGYFGEEIS